MDRVAIARKDCVYFFLEIKRLYLYFAIDYIKSLSRG